MLSHIIAITFLLNPVGQDSDAKIKQGLKALSSHGARLQRLKFDFAGSKTEESRKEKHTELKNAVAQFEKMLISAHRSKVIDASQAGRELEAAWYLLAGVTRDLGDISAAEALIARCLTVSEGTHLVVKRLVTQAFYHAKTDQKKTIKQLEAIRSTKGFMKGSVLKGREERDVLRHLAWLYTQTGDTQKAVDIYEQYFQWFIDTRASIDAVELKLAQIQTDAQFGKIRSDRSPKKQDGKRFDPSARGPD